MKANVRFFGRLIFTLIKPIRGSNVLANISFAFVFNHIVTDIYLVISEMLHTHTHIYECWC